MDSAFAEMYAELDSNIRIPSAAKINNPISSSKISSKRTSTSATVNSDTKFRKLDDEDASQFLLQKQLEEMEDELFAQYIAPVYVKHIHKHQPTKVEIDRKDIPFQKH